MIKKEFDYKKELEDLRHKNKMAELEYERATVYKRIEEEMGMIRLKNANMNRMIDKKEHLREEARKKYEQYKK